jgi:hypothetical protein
MAISLLYSDNTPFGILLDSFDSLKKPNSHRPVFFCNFQDVMGINAINKGKNQITKWYKCRKCLTPFGVGNCGKTVVEEPCTKCGRLVGGTHHKTNMNTIALTKSEIIEVVAQSRVKYHIHGLLKAVNQNYLDYSPEVFRFWHCFMHMFYFGILHFELFSEKELIDIMFYKNKQKLKIANEAEAEEKRIAKSGLSQYLINHILCDIEILKELTQNVVDIEKFLGLLVIDLGHEISLDSSLKAKMEKGKSIKKSN